MQPTLELSMIVKNGAKGLARCLESVAGLVDRITIGDTGSSDETSEIAARTGHLCCLCLGTKTSQKRATAC